MTATRVPLRRRAGPQVRPSGSEASQNGRAEVMMALTRAFASRWTAAEAAPASEPWTMVEAPSLHGCASMRMKMCGTAASSRERAARWVIVVGQLLDECEGSKVKVPRTASAVTCAGGRTEARAGRARERAREREKKKKRREWEGGWRRGMAVETLGTRWWTDGTECRTSGDGQKGRGDREEGMR